MTIVVREAQEKDIESMGKLLRQVNKIHHDLRPDLFKLGRKYDDEQLKHLLSNGKTPIFAAVDENDCMVGYCITQIECIEDTPLRCGMRSLYIDDICVDEAARGQHVGQLLYRHARTFAKEQGCHNITLHVWEGNTGALKFYQAMGMHTQFTCLEEVL